MANNQEMPSLAPVLEQVTPAVVNISVSGKKITRQRLPEQFRFFFGPNMPDEQVSEQPFQALGSGVIIDAKKGYVITNAHVVHEADEIKVNLKDGREYATKKIGEDKQSDIALLQIKAEDLVQIKFADSDELRVGDYALAIGNPFGLGQTVTLRHCQRPGSQRPQHRKSGELHPDRCGHQLRQLGRRPAQPARGLIGINTPPSWAPTAATSASALPSRPTWCAISPSRS